MSATTAYQRHAVLSSTLRFVLNNYLDCSSYRDCLYSYHLKYWSAGHFLTKTAGTEGILLADNYSFRIVYAKGVSRGKILAMPSGDQLALSFRVPDPAFGILPIVYVTLPHPTRN